MTAESVALFVALIAVASIVVLVSRGLGIPDEVGLLLVGLGAALFLPPQTLVTPDLVLLTLLPGLVFEAAYRLDFDQFRASLWSVGLLAVPGVLITAAVVAFVLSAATGMDPKLAFLIGAMISPTDPAAMIAAFARLRTPSGLATLIQSESLLNDGTGIVLFTVALGSSTAAPLSQARPSRSATRSSAALLSGSRSDLPHPGSSPPSTTSSWRSRSPSRSAMAHTFWPTR